MSLSEKVVNFLRQNLRKNTKTVWRRFTSFCVWWGALDKNVGEFLNAIGLPTLQGYGLTETSPVVSCNLPGLVKVDTVGPPFKTNQVKIVEDGEILVKGENVMLGYWNKKKKPMKL